jgi:glycosyltransferase involved in cell wall biosynthesis
MSKSCWYLSEINDLINKASKIYQYDLIDEQEVQSSIPAFKNQAIGMTIIIPVHNEESRLVTCLKRTVEYCKSQSWDYELILVEDGSIDGTVKLINDFISCDNRIKLISNKNRLGKGKAIRNGVSLAGKEHIGYMDADLSAGPSEFKRLLLFIDQFDIVVGSRILRGGLPPIKRPFIRTLLSRCYSKLFRTLFKEVQVYDPQCGLKLFKFNAAHTLLNKIETSGFAFDCEVIVKAQKLGLTVKEVPINWEHDYGSKIRVLNEIVAMGSDLLKVWYKIKVLRD